MANFWYNLAKKQILDGTLDLVNDSIKVMLCTSSYVADADDDYVDAGGVNDAVDHELSGTGYTAGWGNGTPGDGRQTLASKVFTEDDTNNWGKFDAADPAWTSLAADCGNASQLLMIKEGGADDTTSLLIAHYDFALTTNGSPVTAQIHANGLTTLS